MGPQYQAPIVHGIDSRIVFFTLSNVLCVRCQYIGIHSGNVYFLFITANILETNLGHETVLYCNVLYSTVLYCTVLYRTVLYYTVLYSTIKNEKICREQTNNQTNKQRIQNLRPL